MKTPITLYGAKRCHKTQYYRELLDAIGVSSQFLDVEKDDTNAQKLRNLYASRKLNFPTLTVGDKVLRNPTNKDLNRWIFTDEAQPNP